MGAGTLQSTCSKPDNDVCSCFLELVAQAFMRNSSVKAGNPLELLQIRYLLFELSACLHVSQSLRSPEP
jgi:hypothetical protein